MNDQELYELKKAVARTVLHQLIKDEYSKIKSSAESKLKKNRTSVDDDITVAELIVDAYSQGKTTDAILKNLDKELVDMPDIYKGVNSIEG